MYLYVCVYIYSYIFVYIYIHVCVHIYSYIFVYIYIHISIRIYVYTHRDIYIYTCTYIYIHVYKYVHIYVYQYVLICIDTLYGSSSLRTCVRPASPPSARCNGSHWRRSSSGFMCADVYPACLMSRYLWVDGACSGQFDILPSFHNKLHPYMPSDFTVVLSGICTKSICICCCGQGKGRWSWVNRRKGCKRKSSIFF